MGLSDTRNKAICSKGVFTGTASGWLYSSTSSGSFHFSARCFVRVGFAGSSWWKGALFELEPLDYPDFHLDFGSFLTLWLSGCLLIVLRSWEFLSLDYLLWAFDP